MNTRPDWTDTIALTLTLAICGCGNAQAARHATEQHADVASAATTPRPVACTLVSAADMTTMSGQSFTSAEAIDDVKQNASDCHYSSATNPAGASIHISWIVPSDYSDPAEHAALQKAMVGGARLGGKLAASIAPTGGVPNGTVAGVGDDAFASMALLTARKGDVSIMVQIAPVDMQAFVSDTAVSRALLESEKAVAVKVFSQLQ